MSYKLMARRLCSKSRACTVMREEIADALDDEHSAGQNPFPYTTMYIDIIVYAEFPLFIPETRLRCRWQFTNLLVAVSR
jgi:hypothetical protein